MIPNLYNNTSHLHHLMFSMYIFSCVVYVILIDEFQNAYIIYRVLNFNICVIVFLNNILIIS